VSIACYMREQRICHLTLVSEAHLHFVTHTTFQELLLTIFTLYEILRFEILSSEKHFCHKKSLKLYYAQR